MKDREPTKPGRVLITPEGGGTPFYATMTMADEPTELGDAPVKVNLLPDDVAAALGLTGNPQVADALAKIKTLIDGNTTLANSKAKIITGSYTGTGVFGTSNRNSFVFTNTPAIVFIYNKTTAGDFQMAMFIFGNSRYWTVRGRTTSNTVNAGDTYIQASADKTLTWYATTNAAEQLNVTGELYNVVAICL